MERTLGRQVGEYLHRLHERNGVVFHLQQSVAEINEHQGDAQERPDDRGGWTAAAFVKASPPSPGFSAALIGSRPSETSAPGESLKSTAILAERDNPVELPIRGDWVHFSGSLKMQKRACARG